MRVWIARAEPAASATAERLRALGHAPLVAPLLAVAPTGEPPPQGRFDAALLTSANAAAPLADAYLDPLPVFAVGHRTAEAARAAGLADVTVAGGGDARSLAELVRSRLQPGTRLLHAAGADRKAEPAATLAASGYAVSAWIVYRAEPVAALPPAVVDALSNGDGAPLEAVLHYSRRSAEIALARSERAGLGPAFRALQHLCLSTDVAVPLVEAGIAAHFVAARPDEASLLSGLAGSP